MNKLNIQLQKLFGKILILLMLFFFNCNIQTQVADKQIIDRSDEIADFKLMFYNTENYFDTQDDSLTRDEEFLPEGDKRWDSYRFYDKRNKLAKVIIAVGGWQPPDVVGLCEVENRFVLESLVKYSPLKNYNYQIVHKESPDSRGIDVAFLYRPDKFIPIYYETIEIVHPTNTSYKTRDILCVEGYVPTLDKNIYIFINHWPSKWGGDIESEEFRVLAATFLRQKIDSISLQKPNTNFIITGDFNDTPFDKSLVQTLNAETNLLDTTAFLYNYSLQYSTDVVEGTHRYQGKWSILDQLIISKTLIANVKTCNVFAAPFLLEKEDLMPGLRPFRTYNGFKYSGGFSDHLPVYIELTKN